MAPACTLSRPSQFADSSRFPALASVASGAEIVLINLGWCLYDIADSACRMILILASAYISAPVVGGLADGLFHLSTVLAEASEG